MPEKTEEALSRQDKPPADPRTSIEADRSRVVSEERIESVVDRRLEVLIGRRAETIIAARSFSGPMPPPDVLQGYDEILPGAAERILAEFENQAAHRRQLEERVVKAGTTAQARGQWMAYTLSLIVTGSGSFLLATGNDIAGLAAVLFALAAPISVLALEKRRGSRELEEKRRELEKVDETDA